jgi:hypothetical protein
MTVPEIPFERSETTIVLPDGDLPVALLRLASADATDALLDALDAVVRNGEAAVLDRMPTRRAIPNLRKPITELNEPLACRALVDTLGRCAAAQVAELGLEVRAGPVPSGWIVGAASTVRYVLASASAAPQPTSFVEAVRLRRDYRPFSRLWRTPQRGMLDDPRYVEIPIRPVWVRGIGETLADMHGMWLLDTDAYEGNFLWRQEDMLTTRVDFADSYYVWRAPSALQCATTFVPLLSKFSPTDYRWFKLGYQSGGEARAQRVFDAIEFSDATGWMQAYREGDPGRAAELMRAQIAADEDMDAAWCADLWNGLGIFLSHAAHHDEAEGAFDEAERLAAREPRRLASVVFNHAQAQLRAGAVSAAVGGFRRVRDLRGDEGAEDRLVAAAEQLIAQCEGVA